MTKKTKAKNSSYTSSGDSWWKRNRSTIIILGAVLLLVLMSMLIEGNEKSKEIDYSSLSADVQQWVEDTSSEQYVVTVIALSYCGYCEQYKPVITQIANDNGLKLYWFEIDTMSDEDANVLQTTYELEQYSGSSPYSLVTYGGEFVSDVVGYMEKADTETFLKGAGAIK